MAARNQNSNESKGIGKPGKDVSTRVAFDMAPPMAAEVARIMSVSDLSSPPEVFRRAFTLLRIHVDAELQGRQIIQIDSANPSEKYMITLPFVVDRSAGEPSSNERK